MMAQPALLELSEGCRRSSKVQRFQTLRAALNSIPYPIVLGNPVSTAQARLPIHGPAANMSPIMDRLPSVPA
jgi:hypothetical protein